MKFISKNANLRIILKPGLPAQPIAGLPATPSVSVKFQDGVAVVNDEKILEKMYSHPGFNTDFIAVDNPIKDNFAGSREDIEPRHVITEIKYGHVENTVGSPKKNKIPAELQGVITEMANEIANKKIKEMLPSLIKETMQEMANISAAKKVLSDEGTKLNSVEGDASLLEDMVTPTKTKDNSIDEYLPVEIVKSTAKKKK